MSEFSNFNKLCLHRAEGRDFQIKKKRRGSRVAIIAPHGGTIEPVTKKLAEATALHSIGIVLKVSRAIVGTSISLHHFDEPQFLELIAPCDIVVAIRGRREKEDPATVFVGGLNEVQRDIICLELKTAGFPTTTANTKFRGRDRSNICNREQQGMGVQLELPRSFGTGLIAIKCYSTASLRHWTALSIV